MSLNSAHSSSLTRRRQNTSNSSHRRSVRLSRDFNNLSPPPLQPDEVYKHVLAVAYLHHLLQPRPKKKQYVTRPKRSHSSFNGVLAELGSGLGGSSSLKLPSGFVPNLLSTMQGVLIGQVRQPGLDDRIVKQSFAEAYTAFTDASFRKSIEKERKLEPLILIFYSSATKAVLKQAASPSDPLTKVLPDRHVVLFVRLITQLLQDHSHFGDRTELVNKLESLERRMLSHDQSLVIDDNTEDTMTVEVVAPISYDVNDMQLVKLVIPLFYSSYPAAQAELDQHRETWTEAAALADLKQYQQRMNSDLPGALRRADFQSDEAFEEWKHSEARHISNMILEIVRTEASFSATSAVAERIRSSDVLTSGTSSPGPGGVDRGGSGGGGVPGDRSSIYSGRSSFSESLATDFDMVGESPYTYIPRNPREAYVMVLKRAMAADKDLPEVVGQRPSLLSKASETLMLALAEFWRIPHTTCLISQAEVAVQMYLDLELTLEQLEALLEALKTPMPEARKRPHITHYTLALTAIDLIHWTHTDVATYQRVLQQLHDALLRDLFDLLTQCYQSKWPRIGLHMQILTAHIQSQAVFTPNPQQMDDFAQSLRTSLREKATSVYRSFLNDAIPPSKEDWNFGHIMELGGKIVELTMSIKKRFTRKPEILGVRPYPILVECIFPSFEADAKVIVERILALAKKKQQELPIQEGFLLYQELVKIRTIHQEMLPNSPFGMPIEDILVGFVWRWIEEAENRVESIAIEAIKLDQFHVRGDADEGDGGGGGGGGEVPDHLRHSASIIDLFSFFHQILDEIMALGWANEVHMAKFMTGISRIYTKGLTAYCQIVEDQFTKEMDRPTNEEAAAVAAGQSTQQKLSQMLEAAWTAKKPEPFQFRPESFVRLNNIEYAIQELDKLEKKMNVDACVATLERSEGSRLPRLQRPHSFVFTVKMVEAEDLQACDHNGLSDPYVILCDERRKRLAKTRIVYRSLNPRWDESVDIKASGPLTLVATIWDYDMVGTHDLVGRTSIKLDPMHFSDYLPREFWLDLDTQGRLLVRVSMEGERDDIEYYYGKSFRQIKRTERDMVRRITDKMTMQINAVLSRDTLRRLVKPATNFAMPASVTSFWKKHTGGSTTNEGASGGSGGAFALARRGTGTPPSPATAGLLSPTKGPPEEEALLPLFAYFNDNFSIIKQTLTEATMMAVMTRLWKETLMAMEALLVPPLSDKPTNQQPLTSREMDVMYLWLNYLFDFFHARNPEGHVDGVPESVLKSTKWHEIATINFFYFESTQSLIRESERIAALNAQRAQELLQNPPRSPHRGRAPPAAPSSGARNQNLLDPSAAAVGGTGRANLLQGFASLGTIRRGNSVMMNRNLGTIRRAREEKRREAEAEPTDDSLLRILRMRPDAARYLKERSRQKERQAAAMAAAMILKNSSLTGSSSGSPAFAGPIPGRSPMAR